MLGVIGIDSNIKLNFILKKIYINYKLEAYLNNLTVSELRKRYIGRQKKLFLKLFEV